MSMPEELAAFLDLIASVDFACTAETTPVPTAALKCATPDPLSLDPSYPASDPNDQHPGTAAPSP